MKGLGSLNKDTWSIWVWSDSLWNLFVVLQNKILVVTGPEKVPEVKYFRKISADFNKQGLKLKFITIPSYVDNFFLYWGTSHVILSRTTSTQRPSSYTRTGAPLRAPYGNGGIPQGRLHHLEAHTSHTHLGCGKGWMLSRCRGRPLSYIGTASEGTLGYATTTTPSFFHSPPSTPLFLLLTGPHPSGLWLCSELTTRFVSTLLSSVSTPHFLHLFQKCI